MPVRSPVTGQARNAPGRPCRDTKQGPETAHQTDRSRNRPPSKQTALETGFPLRRPRSEESKRTTSKRPPCTDRPPTPKPTPTGIRGHTDPRLAEIGPGSESHPHIRLSRTLLLVCFEATLSSEASESPPRPTSTDHSGTARRPLARGHAFTTECISVYLYH
jgi:hypothetical protein